MKLKNLLLLLLFIGIVQVTNAQVTTNPAQPTVNDAVEIIYDATQGTSGLVGAAKVYMHSSIGTDPSGQTWADGFTVGDWGVDNGLGQMTKRDDLGANMWSITITPKTYYSIPDGTIAYNLAMVFRNADGSAEGKSDANGDIFTPLFPDDNEIRITNPTADPFITLTGEQITVEAKAGSTATQLNLYNNGASLASVDNADTISAVFTPASDGSGQLVAELVSGSEMVYDTLNYFVRPTSSTIEELPAGLTKGVNYVADDSVVIVLYAPLKEVVFVIGEMTDYQLDIDYMCRKTSDNHFWLPIGGLNEKQEYAYQFFIDDGLIVADPYCEKILDPDDQWIPETTYPNLKPYPFGKTSGPISIFEINRDEYVWQTTGYVRPPKEELVVYELLVRDFSDNDDYQTVIDSLDYLANMGINAIELMPIMEFKGNDSWGYNPTFFMAVDKAYGTREKFKEFVDKCHEKGIAVILDIALNHAHEWFPYCLMWFDTDGVFRPSAENPFYNPEAKHPFNVFFDMNHEAQDTKDYIDDVNKYWIEEYKIDGYRFDLSKGFTQRFSSDVGGWNNYDQSRVDILTRMANKLWETDPNAYVILEHLGNNDEETVLANAGMMPWGNIHGQFKENILGFSGTQADVTWSSYKERGWNDPNLVAYMESHDEERQMVDALQFGNSNGGYNVKDAETAYERIAAANALFYAIPGPKMFWQFHELGYDFSINYCLGDGSINPDCRVGRKPVKWEYFQEEGRKNLYNKMSEIIRLKTTYDIFNTEDFFISDANGLDGVNHNTNSKFVKLTHQPFTATPSSPDEMNMIVLVNLGVTAQTFIPIFHHTGDWYDHFGNSTLTVTDQNMGIELQPGEFRIYTDYDLELVDRFNPTAILSSAAGAATNTTPFSVSIAFNEEVTGFELADIAVTNGVASNLQTTDNITFTVDVTPSAEGDVTISVASNVALDLANNPNDAAEDLVIAYDTQGPTTSLQIKSGTNPMTSPTFGVTVTFSEEVEGFTIDDISVTNAVVSNFQKTGSTTYNADVTTTSFGDNVSITISEGAATDAAGNNASAASLASITTDLNDDFATKGVIAFSSGSSLHVEFADVKSADAKIKVYDLVGNLVVDYKNQGQLENNLGINKQGIFLVHIENYLGMTVKKIYIEK